MSKPSRKDQLLTLLKSAPTDSFLIFALAKEFENENNLQQARENYEKLLQCHQDYTATYYHYGKLLELLEEFDDAEKVYKAGIAKCLESNDLHTKSELQTALINLQIDR